MGSCIHRVKHIYQSFTSQEDMYENTLIIFTSDNGGPIHEPGAASNHPLFGSKNNDWEGGVRTNAFVSGEEWPKMPVQDWHWFSWSLLLRSVVEVSDFSIFFGIQRFHLASWQASNGLRRFQYWVIISYPGYRKITESIRVPRTPRIPNHSQRSISGWLPALPKFREEIRHLLIDMLMSRNCEQVQLGFSKWRPNVLFLLWRGHPILSFDPPAVIDGPMSIASRSHKLFILSWIA